MVRGENFDILGLGGRRFQQSLRVGEEDFNIEGVGGESFIDFI